MKIVNIAGGLGNQMFQYAFAVALQEMHTEDEVRIDTHHYHYVFSKTFHGNNFFHNGFEIGRVFPNSQIKTACIWDIIKASYYMPNYVLSRMIRHLLPIRDTEYVQKAKDAYSYDSTALTSKAYKYYEGYWMAYKYFAPYRHKIQKIYTFPAFATDENRHIADAMCKNNSIAIHVRMGDYVGLTAFSNICTLEYYKRSIAIAREHINNPEFFVFSNDQKWCIDNLKGSFGNAPVRFVTNNQGSESYRDMQLMAMARCNILANSSFSWWSAFLNSRKDNIVIAPSKWMNDRDCENIYCENWIKVANHEV